MLLFGVDQSKDKPALGSSYKTRELEFKTKACGVKKLF